AVRVQARAREQRHGQGASGFGLVGGALADHVGPGGEAERAEVVVAEVPDDLALLDHRPLGSDAVVATDADAQRRLVAVRDAALDVAAQRLLERALQATVGDPTAGVAGDRRLEGNYLGAAVTQPLRSRRARPVATHSHATGHGALLGAQLRSKAPSGRAVGGRLLGL